MQTKWWGWGDLEKHFPLEARPEAWPYLKGRLGLTEEVHKKPVGLEEIQLPACRLTPEALAGLIEVVGEVHCSIQALDRLKHAYGKSYKDLVRLRAGQIANPPDAVVFVTQEAQIEAVLALAERHGFAVVPYGGGTSVVGGLEMPASQAERPFVSLDLTLMNEVLDVDPVSLIARVQPGILGPKLEETLQALGVTLGHYPQSFEFSTLGGWVAARSVGQQSTRYGRIEEMVLGLRLVTPQGVLDTHALPASAQGPDWTQVAVGSEGMLGVISEVRLRVYRLPERRDYRAMIFRDWQSGQLALREIMQGDRHPATLRLSDAAETEALFKLREEPVSTFQRWGQSLFKWYAKRARDIDMSRSCLLIMGFEGDSDQIEQDRAHCEGICEANRAVSLGSGIGNSWYAGRFDLPYLRDSLLDRGVLVDTLETSASWAQLPLLHQAITEALKAAIAADGLEPLVYSHISHVYRTGASLYFTFAARQLEGDELGQWARYKRAASDAILAHGGAVSHHHGIGLDHAAWNRIQLGAEGVRWLAGLKGAVDPAGVLNPGKLGIDAPDAP